MRQGLRGVPGVAVAPDVVLLRQQPDVVRDGARPIHELVGVVDPAAAGVLLDEPERAGQEGMLVAGEPVDAAVGAVAQQEAVAHERALHLGDGAEHARVVVGAEAHLGQEQQRRVDLGRAVVLHEVPPLRVEAVRVDLLAHPVAKELPRGCVARQPRLLHRAHATVERRPHHHPRVGEHGLLAADLPDAAVGSVEPLHDLIEQGLLQRPGEVRLVDAGVAGRLEGDHHLPDHVGLELRVGTVAEAHRRRPLVSGQARQLALG